jgi:osmotically-inducible protein OsmY
MDQRYRNRMDNERRLAREDGWRQDQRSGRDDPWSNPQRSAEGDSWRRAEYAGGYGEYADRDQDDIQRGFSQSGWRRDFTRDEPQRPRNGPANLDYGSQEYGDAGYGRQNFQTGSYGRQSYGAQDYSQPGYDRAPSGYGEYGQQGSYSRQAGIDRGAGESRRGTIPKSYQRSDERIREDIYERIIARSHIDAGDVSVDVKEGHVTLTGEVPERRMKHEIEDLADSCSGVQDVENHIRVRRGFLKSILGGGEDREDERERQGANTASGGTSAGTGRTVVTPGKAGPDKSPH